MKTAETKICLVSPSHVSSNPRLVKEADALREAGYKVVVVSGRNHPPNDALDERLLATRGWPIHRLDFRAGRRNLLRRLRQEWNRRRFALTPAPSWQLAAMTQCPQAAELGRCAKQTGARFFIGHTLAGLVGAALAARASSSPFAFDAEDFHAGETESVINDSQQARAIKIIEGALLPEAAYLTAAAPLIGQTYARTYDLAAEPTTILNVFPRVHAPTSPMPPPADGTLRCYWFSQTIGPERGLETVSSVLRQLPLPIELHLRGKPDENFIARLKRDLEQFPSDHSRRIIIHPPGAPDEMVRLATPYDLGIASELSFPPNRDICLTNKIFTYLLAGLPYLYTPTQAQSKFATEVGDAALLLDATRIEESVARVTAWWHDPERRQQSRQLARQLGRDQFNWERESQAWLQLVQQCLKP